MSDTLSHHSHSGGEEKTPAGPEAPRGSAQPEAADKIKSRAPSLTSLRIAGSEGVETGPRKLAFEAVVQGLRELVLHNYLEGVYVDECGEQRRDPSRGLYHPLGLAPELWGLIMSWMGRLHVASLETCGGACRAFYLATRMPQIYKNLLAMSLMLADCWKSPRAAFMGGKRIHWDGFYACKQTYLRPGVAETGFLTPIHQVTFYRYIRFMHPLWTGPRPVCDRVVVLVTTETPKDAVDILRHPASIDPDSAAMRTSNVFRGRVTREDDVINLCIHDRLGRAYKMRLSIGSKGLCLKCLQYRDLTDASDFGVEEWDLFRLARVRSYH